MAFCEWVSRCVYVFRKYSPALSRGGAPFVTSVKLQFYPEVELTENPRGRGGKLTTRTFVIIWIAFGSSWPGKVVCQRGVIRR